MVSQISYVPKNSLLACSKQCGNVVELERPCILHIVQFLYFSCTQAQHYLLQILHSVIVGTNSCYLNVKHDRFSLYSTPPFLKTTCGASKSINSTLSWKGLRIGERKFGAPRDCLCHFQGPTGQRTQHYKANWKLVGHFRNIHFRLSRGHWNNYADSRFHDYQLLTIFWNSIAFEIFISKISTELSNNLEQFLRKLKTA